MCDICHQFPCHPRCPNATEPVPEFECTECGYGIFAGDKYLEINGNMYCMECLEEKTPEELLELVGESLSIA